MKLYITPAGKTALLASNFLERAREEFGFDIAILMVGSNMANEFYNKFYQENVIIIPISNPFFDNSDYLPVLRRIVKKTVLFCPNAEQVIINSSGGTEKMTSIIKDVSDVLSRRFNVLRVWGIFDSVGGDVIFTTKPEVDVEKELKLLENLTVNSGE